MNRELQRLGAHRVVDIYASTGQEGTYGSGYGVGDDLVLTAAHVVPEAPGYLVRTLDYGVFAAALVWADRREEIDAALLRLEGAPWRDAPDRDSLRWGKLTGNEVKCWALGFPRAQEDAERRRDLDTLLGSVNVTTGYRSRRYEVDVIAPKLPSAAEGRSWWQGMSGAALFGPGRQLLGVLVAEADVYGGSRLEAVPATRLLTNEDFSRLVGAESKDTEEVRDRGEAADLDGRTFLVPPYADLPESAGDAQQLLAEYGVVPFIGREAELRSLRDWGTGPDRFSVAVVTGDQGAGKTRLGAELCKELAATGWSAGFMDMRAMSLALTERTHLELVWPTLLVLDGPDGLTDQVIGLIDRLSRRRRGARLRLLLLDRTPAGAKDGAPLPDHVTWWRKLNRDTAGMVASSTSVTIRLGDGLLTVPEQRRHVAEAMARFGHGASPARPLDLTDRSPLRLHLAALNAVRGDDHRSDMSPEKLLLNHETTRWMQLLDAHQIGDLGEYRAHQALALVTMTAPDQAEAVDLLTALPALDTGDASRERRFKISEWLADSYPGGLRLGMPSHSMVVEQLLEDTPGLNEIVLSIHDHPVRATGHLVTLLETLRLAAERRTRARAALYRLLSGRLAALIDAVAAEPDSQLPGMLDAALEAVSDPDASAGLAAVAATLRHPQPSEQFTINQLRCRILELAVGRHAHRPEATRARADARTDLTAYRAALGDLAGAQAAAEAALSAYRRLPAVPEASLARASGNLGICLALQGRLDKAWHLLEDAASRSAELAARDPAHLPAHADALISLAACQADQGHQVLAIRTLLETLVVSGRGEGIFGGLIEPLGELAASLTDVPGPARAATPDARCYRPPAGTAPPSAQDDHAQLSTLLRLTARLTIGLAGHIPTARRNAVLPGLVPALARQQARFAAWNYAEYLRVLMQLMVEQHEFEYAIIAATESVALFRWVAPRQKELDHRLRLPSGLSQLGECCRLAGRFDQAITHAGEAVAEYRLIRASDAGFPARMLAEALASLGRYLEDADRLPEAVESRREVVALYRDLAAQDDAHLPLLGNSQFELGAVLLDAGESDEAATMLQEGAALLERLTATHPEVTEHLIMAYSLLAELAGFQDDSARSMASAARAVELAEQSAVADPGRWIDHARALCVLSSSLEASGRVGEAFEQADKAVSLVRERAAPLDDEARTTLGWGLSLMSETAYAAGRLEQALATAHEAVSVLTQVDDTGRDFAMLFGVALTAQASALTATQQPDEAIPPALHALELYARPGTTPGLGEYALLTASTHMVLGMARLQLGLPDEALASASAAQSELQHLHAAGSVGKAQLLLAQSYYCEGFSLAWLQRPDDALTPLARAAGLLESFSSDNPAVTLLLANALAALGMCHQQLGNANLALQHADRSIARLGELGQLHPSQRAMLAQALLVHAESWGQLGDEEEAYHGCERILDLYGSDPPDDPAGLIALGRALTISGLHFWVHGDPDSAVSRLKKADAIFGDVEPHVHIAMPLTLAHTQALAGLAECQAALGDTAGAAESATSAIELLRARQFHTQPLLTLMYGQLAKFLAQCFLELGQLPDETLDEAIEAFRSLSIPEAAIELVMALNLRALYQNSLGDTVSAAESTAEAVTVCRGLDDGPSALVLLASTLLLLGTWLLGLGRLTEALALLQESAGHFADLIGTPTYPVLEHLEVELKLGMCLTGLDRSSEAAEHFNMALEVLRPLTGADPDHQPELGQTIMLLAGQLTTFAQEQGMLRNSPITEILGLSAEILDRLGYHDAAEPDQEGQPPQRKKEKNKKKRKKKEKG